MMLLFHILVALSSLLYTTYAYITPSKAKLHVSYALVAMTIASGTYLVISTHAHILQACTTGLLYLGAVSIGLAGVRRKLAKATAHTD